MPKTRSNRDISAPTPNQRRSLQRRAKHRAAELRPISKALSAEERLLVLFYRHITEPEKQVVRSIVGRALKTHPNSPEWPRLSRHWQALCPSRGLGALALFAPPTEGGAL